MRKIYVFYEPDLDALEVHNNLSLLNTRHH